MPQLVSTDNERVFVFKTDEEVREYFRKNPRLEAVMQERRKQLDTSKTNLYPVVSLGNKAGQPKEWKFTLHVLVDFAMRGETGRYLLYKAEDFAYYFGQSIMTSFSVLPTEMTDLSTMLDHIQQDTMVSAQAVFARIKEQFEVVLQRQTMDYKIYAFDEEGFPYGLGFSVLPGLRTV